MVISLQLWFLPNKNNNNTGMLSNLHSWHKQQNTMFVGFPYNTYKLFGVWQYEKLLL